MGIDNIREKIIAIITPKIKQANPRAHGSGIYIWDIASNPEVNAAIMADEKAST